MISGSNIFGNSDAHGRDVLRVGIEMVVETKRNLRFHHPSGEFGKYMLIQEL